MRREPEFFEDRELVLLYIARKLKDALALEKLLDEKEVDYLIEVDYYSAGIIFRSERAGAFFYVEEPQRDLAAELLRSAGYRPQQDQ